MTQVLETLPHGALSSAREAFDCYHCGAPCPDASLAVGDRFFCCAGCRTVYQLLEENGLQRFYDLDARPGVRPDADARAERFAYLNEDAVKKRLLDFSDGVHARVTFHLPAIHCAACVWLLENLFRLHPGIGRSEVHFPRKEAAIQFDETKITLGALAGLLASLGYEPRLNLGSVEPRGRDPVARRLAIQLGIAGFAFGNIMLLSFPSYLGLNPATEGALQRWFGFISLALALPVLLVSASDYWRAAWTSLRQRAITIDLPIAVGLAALFGQSAWDIIGHRGEGYLDSFSGLVFLLLVGRWFQRKTYDTLSFDRDYRSYFPLSVTRKRGDQRTSAPVTSLSVGDVIVVRNQEIVPADAVIRSGAASVDYSFVTGESTPVSRGPGDYVYAGGRQNGGAVELEIVKEVSQSYLTSLWNNPVFHRADRTDIQSLTNRAARWFTYAVIAISISVVGFWLVRDPSVALRAFTSVLLVACPCALALSAPFTLGTALRLLGRQGLYLRNAAVAERLAGINAVVFDKTGTLTTTRERAVIFQGASLSDDERRAVGALARHSTHPISRAIGEQWPAAGVVEDFVEIPGAGVQGCVGGRRFQLGSREWLRARGDDTAAAYLAIDGQLRGRFLLQHLYRPAARDLFQSLARRFRLAVISGDAEQHHAGLRALCDGETDLRFRQSPFDKLAYIRNLQASGGRVLMVGDGLNDAGALKQSDVGMALTEDTSAFSPSCDAILEAGVLGRLPSFLQFTRDAMAVMKTAFALSITYNLLAIGIAASGRLSPVVSAILMPISSFTVIGLSVGATRLMAARRGVGA